MKLAFLKTQKKFLLLFQISLSSIALYRLSNTTQDGTIFDGINFLKISFFYLIFTISTLLTSKRTMIIFNYFEKESFTYSIFLKLSLRSQCLALFAGTSLASDLNKAIFYKTEMNKKIFGISRLLVLERMISLSSLLLILVIVALMQTAYYPISIFAVAIVIAISIYKSLFIITTISLLVHSLKFLSFLLFTGFTLELSSKIILGLLVDILPISWNGLGVSHISFSMLLDQLSSQNLYNSFFLAKVAHKLSGLPLLKWNHSE